MNELRFRRKIAAGSAVDAFLAETKTGSVIVQVSHPEVAADAELYGRFLDSTRESTTQHRHPALLAPERAHCQADGRFVLVTGPASGRTAADHLREYGPLATDEAIRWGVRLCDALEFLHAHGVVHGHLAPHNLYLDGDPRAPEVRLLDTALLLFRGTKSLPRSQVLVAPEYLSPERCAGRRGTPACDVYGFGVLLFELLTGLPPYSGRSAVETRALHLHAELPALRPGLEEWAPVVSRCLAKRPSDRYRSMADVRDAMRGLKPLVTPPIEIQLVEPAQAAHPTLGPGAVLGRYRIEEVLGEGGMGHVFAAKHLSIDRQVAIKVLRPELSRVEAHVQRFMAEAQAVNRVKHPNIIAVEDLVRDGERVYFVMERLEGPTLKAVAKTGPLELTRVVRLMRQAASALAAAHGVGVIHRDVKPDNIMLVRDERGDEAAKVLDFGVARVRDLDPTALYRTQVGQVVGTPLWMAPEQVMGREVDARADVYALGMVLYVLIARRFPFEGSELSAVVMHRLQKEAAPLGETSFLGEVLPLRLRALIKAMLARELTGRPASMAQVAHELELLEKELTTPSVIDAHQRRWWHRFRS